MRSRGRDRGGGDDSERRVVARARAGGSERAAAALLERDARRRWNEEDEWTVFSAPARGSVIRRRSTSTPTEEDRGTPTECEERRLTSSSVQCGQRFVPDSMFKTPAPSGFGALTAAQTQSPPTREEMKARERSLDAALVRLRSQILFCEEASGRGRRTLESYGWTEHDVLCAAFRRAGTTVMG